MKKPKVLFLCVHNSARSQMAEAFLNALAPEEFEAESAGFEPRPINPVVLKAMAEIGIDISSKKSKAVFDLVKKGEFYAYVITVCDESSAERCPIFPGVTHRLHWSFEDPSAITGSEEEKLAQTRIIRDQIRQKVEEFIKEHRQ
jgi:arsenate reductase